MEWMISQQKILIINNRQILLNTVTYAIHAKKFSDPIMLDRYYLQRCYPLLLSKGKTSHHQPEFDSEYHFPSCL